MRSKPHVEYSLRRLRWKLTFSYTLVTVVALRMGAVDRKAHTARVIGKGGKERNIFFDDVAWRAVADYLEARGTPDSDAAPVFARHNAMTVHRLLALPITTDTVRDVLHALCAAAKVDIPLTPHWLRHWFATRILESTNDLALTQDMLGHASPATTRIYAQVSTKRMRAAHAQAFPK